MTSTKEAEDNNLPVSASHEIDIMKYVSYRRNEIELLTSESFLSKGAVKGKKPNKSQFQLLPRHMRRRTMGFIRKRLPHRIRQTAVIKPPSKVNKRPSRKYRRKPRKLLSEYERRKRAVMWLETHIWHAKRFHMSKSLFGYRLALFDNCKAKRAVFRALKSGCCLHDESYYVCHELTGRQEDLIAGLNPLCSPRLGLTFAAKMLTSGQFEGRVILYESDRYPFGCIGPCRFIWKPEDKENSSGERKLWLWSHPSVYLDVQKQLIDVWNMTPIEEEPSTKEEDSSPKNKKIKLGNDALISIATKFKSSKVQLECLKDNLIRFKLLGPLSTTILANVLKTFDSENMNSLELSLYEKQINLWNKMKLMIKDPNEVVCSSVLGLLVKDPRLAMPKKKSFNQINEQNQKIDARKSQLIKQEVNEEIRKSVLSHSQIWDKNVIEELNSKKKSTHEINKLRQGFLIPGTELTQVETHSHIPVILIQNSTLAAASGSVGASIRNGSLSSGWDLILPKTWAMSFWMCLVHFGARAIAQAELNYLTFESGNLQFPNEYIDTKSSENELNKSKLDLYAKHSRRPASKRVNFIRQHFLTPFYHPIRGILSLNLGLDHLTPKHFILRDKFILSKIQTAYFTRRVAEIDLIDRQHLNHSYIAVRLQCDNRGTLDNFSILYQHNETTDQNDTEKDDSKLVMRSILDEHKKECIKKLASDEKNKTRDKKVTLNKLIRANSNPNELLLDESVFLKFQRELSDSKSFHRPIGFVINGAFNLACGKCTANGFVLTKSILESIEQKKQQQPKQQNTNFVLFKTPTCDIYKTARITNIFI